VASALCLAASALPAQEPELERLKRQLDQMQKAFEQMQELHRREMEALRRQLDQLQKGQPAPTTPDPVKQLMQQPLTPMSPPPGATPADSVRMADLEKRVEDLSAATRQATQSRFNPALGLIGETIFSYRSQGSDITGSERPGGWDAFLRSAELNLEANIDPFALGYAIVNASADSQGEAALELEEAALVTTALPWNLALRVGRFFAEFGRLSLRHDHELPFVNRPLPIESYVFGESKTDGIEANWLIPARNYLSLTAGAGTQFSELSTNPGRERRLNEINVWSRLSTYFDLSSHVNLELGLSGMWNDRADDIGGVVVMPDGSTQTQRRRGILAADMTVRYQPLAANRYRGLEWGTEYFYNLADFDFDPDGSLDPDTGTGPSGDEFRGRVHAQGLYSYLAGRLSRRWTLGFLFDWVQSPFNRADETYRYSPYVTYWPSEFQMLRLQYSYSDRHDPSGLAENDHAVYLQWSFILGAHAHAFRQR
jgi:hypothetical protein